MRRLKTLGAAVLTAALLWHAGPASAGQEPPRPLTRAVLDRSLTLGKRFLLNNQRPEGNFYYCYDFVARRDSPEDQSVRQAGALWGLALIHRDSPTAETARAVRRGLAFFHELSRQTAAGARYVTYPGDPTGRTGAQALICLTLIEMVLATEQAEARRGYGEMLDGYLTFLLSLRREDGLFFGNYDPVNGRGRGEPSPYSDGESLLALARAARYAGRDDLRPAVMASAERMHAVHVVDALRYHPDSAQTKGYYQWGTMAYHEIYTSGWPDVDIYALRAIGMAHWMIDVHRTLDRTRNTAYAHEGLVSAWELARLSGSRNSQEIFGDVVEQGLAKLTSWQVGGPMQNAYLRGHPTDDPRALGGVMNGAADPDLRIDVTQHQMHAVILARRHIYKPGGG